VNWIHLAQDRHQWLAFVNTAMNDYQFLKKDSAPWRYEGVSKSFRTESIYTYNNKRSLRNNTKVYGGKTH
jgi:hypothetical protein